MRMLRMPPGFTMSSERWFGFNSNSGVLYVEISIWILHIKYQGKYPGHEAMLLNHELVSPL